MEAWIKSLLDLAPSSVRTLAAGIRDRILALYSWVNKVLTGAFSGWGKLATALLNARNWVVWGLGEAYGTLRWLILIKIPGFVSVKATELRTWATGVVNAAKTELKGLLTTLDKWVKAAIAAATSALNDLRTWATKRVNEITATLATVVSLVNALLTSPTRMAQWLVGAITKEIWLYAERNADRIFRWAQQKSIAFAVDKAKQIENLLGRLL